MNDIEGDATMKIPFLNGDRQKEAADVEEDVAMPVGSGGLLQRQSTCERKDYDG